MVAVGLPLPEMKYDTFFTITLRRPPKEEMPGSEKSSVKILEALRANKNVSAVHITGERNRPGRKRKKVSTGNTAPEDWF